MRALTKKYAVIFLTVLISTVVHSKALWQTLPSPSPMPAAVKSGMAPINDIQMYYALYGTQGSPVLLIHGGLGYSDVWSDVVKGLMKDHVVIVADSRGHGRSTRSSQAFGYDLMASDYLALMDYLKLDKVALVGWSDGGIIGLDIAMSHPERLTFLFANAANSVTSAVKPDVMENKTFNDYIDVAAGMYQMLSPTPDEFEAFVAQISEMWMTQPNWSSEQLAQITTPTMIAVGEHDEAIKFEHSEYLAKTIPSASLLVMKNVSHFSMLQDPDQYVAAVRQFIE